MVMLVLAWRNSAWTLRASFSSAKEPTSRSGTVITSRGGFECGFCSLSEAAPGRNSPAGRRGVGGKRIGNEKLVAGLGDSRSV